MDREKPFIFHKDQPDETAMTGWNWNIQIKLKIQMIETEISKWNWNCAVCTFSQVSNLLPILNRRNLMDLYLNCHQGVFRYLYSKYDWLGKCCKKLTPSLWQFCLTPSWWKLPKCCIIHAKVHQSKLLVSAPKFCISTQRTHVQQCV